MRRVLFFFWLAGAAAPVQASGDCPAFGLSSAFLQEHFCSQLRDLSAPAGTGTTRSILPEGDPDQPLSEDWAALPLIQDAYRADPQKTLELIARIRGAGGLPLTDN